METMIQTDVQVLYDVDARITRVDEYGVTMQQLLSGQGGTPAEGIRIDIAFEGTLQGARLNGTLSGIDYLYARPDGRIQLHIHARITTTDGANVSLFIEGTAAPEEGGRFRLRENCSLHTSDVLYNWVNGLTVWGVGEVHPATGEIRVKAYSV